MDDELFRAELRKHLRAFLTEHAEALSADNVGFVAKLIHQIQEIEEAVPVEAPTEKHRFPHT